MGLAVQHCKVLLCGPGPRGKVVLVGLAVQHCKVLRCGPGSREKVVLVGLAVQHCKVLRCGPGPRGGVRGACCTTLQSTALWSWV